MTPADERRWRELAGAVVSGIRQLHVDIDSLVKFLYPVQEQKNSAGEQETAARQSDLPPLGKPRVATELYNAYIEQQKSEYDKTYRLQRKAFWIQFGILAATTAAFLAAAYYAWIAKQQHETMEKQTTLLRQQLVGTQAAVVRVSVNHDMGHITISVINSGLVIAKDIDVVLKLEVKSLPDEKVTSLDCSFKSAQVLTGPSGLRQSLCVLPGDIDKLLDDLQHLRRTIKLTGHFRFDNGFGDETSEDLCFAYLPRRDPIKLSSGTTWTPESGLLTCSAVEATLKSIRDPRK